MSKLRFILNGKPVETEAADNARLLDVLRDTLGLTGTKEGCGVGECGACTVIVDGIAVDSCLYPALRANGKSVTTIEGLAKGRAARPPAAGGAGSPRAAVRLLHAGIHHERKGAAGSKPAPHARRGQSCHCRQPLPLHGL